MRKVLKIDASEGYKLLSGNTKRSILRELEKTQRGGTRVHANTKNVRLRKDGRFEWQKMIAGVWHREIDRDYRVLKRKIAERERELKNILKHTRFVSRLKKDYPILFDLCKVSVKANRKDANSVRGLLNKHLSKLNKPINEYTKTDILTFLKELPIQPLIDPKY